MRLGSQKKKIISLVLVFGCIYAVNACAHPLVGSFTFHISNQAPKSDFGDITISSDSEPTKPCKNSSGDLFSIDIPSLGAGSTDFTKIGIQYGSTNDFCYADIQYGGKYTTKVKITWVAATDGGNGAVFHSITRVNGDPLGSDNAFTDWSLTIASNNNGLLMTEATPKPTNGSGLFTLTYLQQKASAIRLTNNNTASGSYISFNQPDPSLSQNPNHCSFIAKQDDGKDPPVLNQVRAKPGESKTVYFMPFTKEFTSCQMKIDTKFDQQSPDSPTRVIVEHKNPKDTTTPLTVKIDTTEDTLGVHALDAFNARNNSFAVKYGTMMKLDLSTAGQVNFDNPPLPFPLLKTTPTDISLDTLAFDLLNKDLPTDPATDPDGKLVIAKSIFNNYKNDTKTSRDIAQDMQIAAGMMKLHSKIDNDKDDKGAHPFEIWSNFFNNLNSGLNNTSFVNWGTEQMHGTTPQTEYWNCHQKDDQCYIPFHDIHMGESPCWYPVGMAPDDTLAQISLAAAYIVASKALALKYPIPTKKQKTEISTFSLLSQLVKSAIHANNTTGSTTKGDLALKGTQAPYLLHSPKDPIRLTTNYSGIILPLINLFIHDNTSKTQLDMSFWTGIVTNTIVIENTLQTTDRPILGAGHKISDPPFQGVRHYDDGMTAGDLSSKLIRGIQPPLPSSNWSFGDDDDADYVPMSLGAYLLVSGVYAAQNGNNITSGAILNAEMGTIDDEYFKQYGSDTNKSYKRIKCSMSGITWSCDTNKDSKAQPLDLTPLDMSSYLLAQLGLTAHFGQTDDYPIPKSPVDNSAQIADLTKSFGSKIKRYVDVKGTDNPIDISTLSPIIIAGLYIDDAFKPTPTDGTSFNNPLIDAHSDKDGNIHYYFTLVDPTSSSTLGAQVRSGAQTSYRGE